jgi:hypothetical protein
VVPLWSELARRSDNPQFYNVRGPLRLRPAVELGRQPGCRIPADIETTAADRTPASKLKRLGSAVFPATAASVWPA